MTLEPLVPVKNKPFDPLVGAAEGASVSDAQVSRTREVDRPLVLPDPREVNRCRSCGAPVWWRINPSGARQPFDWDVKNRAKTDMPHHATCPQGKAWQKGKR
jgi:hypothetical protein